MKLSDTAKIELCVVSAIIILAFMFSIIQLISAWDTTHYFGNQIWLQLLFNYLVICICYLLLFFYVESELSKTDERISNAVFFVYLLIAICFLMGIINTYFAILISIKIFIIYFTTNRYHQVHQPYHELTILFACWMFILAATIMLNSNHEISACFFFIAPIALLHYLYAVYLLLPGLTSPRYRLLKYIGSTLLITLVSYLVLGLLLLAFSRGNQTMILNGLYNYGNENNIAELMLALNAPVQLILVPLFAWNIYKARNLKNAEEIYALKTELGKSDATLNFLKSQINPHFLFNALNTLYGTALQENAERTGEGIQKLGDMMRFMLQENMEDKIALSRDVDYLNNYIALQKLRTSVSSDVTIETQIEEQMNNLQIAPMLLIPFVENAFKHGISLQYPSHIKITLQTNNNTLYFDVHNSIHLKNDSDPEKSQSGIGLYNVKQRLALQYPDAHELIIRENAKEFFIHLTLQLDRNT